MARIDLICQDCKHVFQVLTRTAIKERQKRCPQCGSQDVRQTFSSYVRNGPLSSPACGAPGSTSYG